MPDVVVTEFMDEEALAPLHAAYSVLYDATLVDRPADLAPALRNARALIVRNRTQVRAALLDAAPRLEVVGRLGVGLDNIDVDLCKTRGIAVFPATGANDIAVAEYVVASALLLLRKAYAATDAMIAGTWPRNALMGREVSGKVLGLVGFGAIARETATRARALGMSLIAFDPMLDADQPVWRAHACEKVALDALLARADVVSMHVPLDQADPVHDRCGGPRLDEARRCADQRGARRRGGRGGAG